MAEVEVLHPGLFSTIQDFGRNGFRKYGVPGSGAMDKYGSKTANLILQNKADAAVLEITLMGPRLKFSGPTKIAISGADFSPVLNGQPVENNEVLKVEQNDVLGFGKRRNGCRAYIAVSNGFQTGTVLESQSWYEGITEHFKLEKGMKFSYQASGGEVHQTYASLKFNTEYLSTEVIQVFPGPEYEQLSEGQKEKLRGTFSIDPNNNRMAVQLQEKLENTLDPIITGPVLPGTVQLTPSGKLIILMRDCQTTGGYPRVLHLSEKGINTLAQKVAGEEIRFQFL